MTQRWRLYEHLFRGPGRYTLGEGKYAVALDVAEDGTFEPPISGFPLYTIAAIAGGKRDFSYNSLKEKHPTANCNCSSSHKSIRTP